MNEIYREKHNVEYIDSMNHVNMFRQHYEDIPRYTKQVHGDKFPQIEMNIPKRLTQTIQHNLMVNLVF